MARMIGRTYSATLLVPDEGMTRRSVDKEGRVRGRTKSITLLVPDEGMAIEWSILGLIETKSIQADGA